MDEVAGTERTHGPFNLRLMTAICRAWDDPNYWHPPSQELLAPPEV